MAAVPEKADQKTSESVSAHLVQAWNTLRPYRRYPAIKPIVELYESIFTKAIPDWKTLYEISGQAVGVTGVESLAVNIARWLRTTAGALGFVVLTITRCQAGLDDINKKIERWEAEKRTGDPPVKDPQGKPVEPWYVKPIQTAIRAAAVAGTAILLGTKVLKKVPKFPKMPEYIWPLLIIGGLGLGAWYLHTRKKR